MDWRITNEKIRNGSNTTDCGDESMWSAMIPAVSKEIRTSRVGEQKSVDNEITQDKMRVGAKMTQVHTVNDHGIGMVLIEQEIVGNTKTEQIPYTKQDFDEHE